MRKIGLFVAFAVLSFTSMTFAGSGIQTSPAPLFGNPVFGYLDPSTGSMIVSAIVGVFATIALAFKSVWYWITRPFRKKKPQDSAAAK